ncbi:MULTISPECIES: hypothetical protein [unclassified Polaribacter]|uniref:hypothetical protein n=1 Tax=unclassified Polaribacter TaxID=196858 RepID=UPI001CB997DA|nr:MULTISPECIES: hypothetical protein [unclassified Polaribacter]
MPKKNYKVEILQMRKAGIKEKGIYFKMFSFKEILNLTSSLIIDPKLYNFKEKFSDNNECTKYHFLPKPDQKTKIQGSYLINNKDKAIIEFTSNHRIKSPFTEVQEIKFRTTSFEYLVSFKKDTLDDLYYVDKSKKIAQVEVITDNKGSLYDLEYS